MDRYKETFATWNKIASIYQDKFMELELYNDTYDFICSSIDKPKAKLLEIGCGPGNITKYTCYLKGPTLTFSGLTLHQI
jgi:2-polyprenyl-3-methyl-5-hydroxy-6-metoxy-1,4-benzoquinol methylase